MNKYRIVTFDKSTSHVMSHQVFVHLFFSKKEKKIVSMDFLCRVFRLSIKFFQKNKK